MANLWRNRWAVALPALALLAAAPARRPAKFTPSLATAVSTASHEQAHLAWVYFTDKGAASAAPLTPRAVSRRRLRGRVAGLPAEDWPLRAAYVEQVTASVRRVRQRSRWLNAVSVEATRTQLQALATLSFVDRIDLVRRYRRRA